MNVFRMVVAGIVGAWILISSALNAWQIANPLQADATEQATHAQPAVDVHAGVLIVDGR